MVFSHAFFGDEMNIGCPHCEQEFIVSLQKLIEKESPLICSHCEKEIER